MRTQYDDFGSFCTRMWLDYCDENNDLLSAPNRLDHDAYVKRWNEWLLEKHPAQTMLASKMTATPGARTPS